MKKIKKKLNEFVKVLNKSKNTQPLIHGKIVTMSYLSVAVEPIFQNRNLANVEKAILELIDNALLIFKSYIVLSKFKSNKNFENVNFAKNKIFHKMHQNLWQEIWPEHSLKEYDSLVDYRGKRLDYNKIKKEFYNKNVLDFGCGNGSISIALMKRGAKSVYGIDFGKKNILVANKYASIFKFNNKMKFVCGDILKYKKKKKFDFIVCSAVLHHLKNLSQIKKAMKNLVNACKEGTFLYFYVRGFGGVRSLIQESCVKCFVNVDVKVIKEHLYILNFSREKITHLVDWFKAIYLQTKPETLIKIFKDLGFSNIKRLQGPHKNDLDINQISKDKDSQLKFGSGELRYLCEFRKSL
jgi:SAM-dependent methyltransferase